MTQKTLAKPSFKEIRGIINLADVGLAFNPQKIGPMNLVRLRKSRYWQSFEMPTISELVSLVYASLDQKYTSAKNVVKTFSDYYLTGDTAVHYFPEGMFVEDNPELKNGRIVTPSQKTLEKKLGKNEEKGVVFSKDRSVRFVPYGFETGEQTPSELAENPGNIALTGNLENAEKTAKVSTYYELNPFFWALNNADSPTTRVAGLNSGDFGGRLIVVAYDFENDIGKCSFGVRELNKS